MKNSGFKMKSVSFLQTSFFKLIAFGRTRTDTSCEHQFLKLARLPFRHKGYYLYSDIKKDKIKYIIYFCSVPFPNILFGTVYLRVSYEIEYSLFGTTKTGLYPIKQSFGGGSAFKNEVFKTIFYLE